MVQKCEVMSAPRNEYPRPQLVGEEWVNLNGQWDFEIDDKKLGIEKEYFNRKSLKNKIIVPFCPGSKLSGIGHTNFMDQVLYLKKLICQKQIKNNPAFWCSRMPYNFVYKRHKGRGVKYKKRVTWLLLHKNNGLMTYDRK